jgi:hypothetical protein
VAVVRAFVPSVQISKHAHGQVVEYELDMHRTGPPASATASKFRGWMRWLMPGAHPVGAPMRSVDRELEDLWPSGNRQT